jgi:4-diphosphocytidyl-2-C-methyl-D-erythritol kinase
MITLNAPAKINWSLYVLDRRPDGYHNIVSLMQSVGLYDTLSFKAGRSLMLNSDMSVPQEQNLVFRAAIALQKFAGIDSGAFISLKKEIPTGAGLGGGSSDAASALIGLNRLWGLGLSLSVLGEIGAALGSDVPFFLNSPSAIAHGRGELLIPTSVRAGYTLLLVKPKASIPTVWAYQTIANLRQGIHDAADLTNQGEKLNNIKLIIRTLGNGPITLLGDLLHNDFEEVAIERYPVIGEVKKKLLGAGAAAALLCGSGSALFGFFEDRKTALRASDLFSAHWNRVVETL